MGRCATGLLVGGVTTQVGGRGASLDPQRRTGDAGMVTAELAVGILSVVVVLAFLLFAIGVGIAHLRTQEASRAGARAAARGDSASEVRTVARDAMPGARVKIRRGGSEHVSVEVLADVQLPFVGARMLTVASRSIAQAEPK